MNAYVKLTVSILLIVFALIGANFFIPHKFSSSVSSMKQVYFVVAIVGVSFLGGFYLLYNAIKAINKKREENSL